jgi:hypothetical protein
MTIDELMTRLEDARDELGGETDVRIALQPGYPLEASIKGCLSTSDMEDMEDDEPLDMEVKEKLQGFWIVIREPKAYTPVRAMWEAAY